MTGTDERQPYGWAGPVGAFLATPANVVISALEEHLTGLLHLRASSSQLEAWREEIDILRRSLRDVAIARPDVADWGIVLEYELLLEGGRRPDAILLTGATVISMEFKTKDHVSAADRDQAAAYARDLAEYHSQSHHLDVRGVLIPTLLGDHRELTDGVESMGPGALDAYLEALPANTPVDVAEWLAGEYAPLPSLIEAARMIFRHKRLPRIRRCESSGVPEAVERLGQIVEHCDRESTRALAFLAGVPGAGKTLAGLQLVYERSEGVAPAVFLSGNSPLVQVLRDALEAKSFVQDLHAFIKTYHRAGQVPKQKVVVFDEAQRAWDADYMAFKKGIAHSEPELLVEIGQRIPDWCTLVGLVGDGQEIYAGEEGGIGQWADALRSPNTDDWAVYCPPRMTGEFVGLDVHAEATLDLTVTLRSRQAEQIHEWVSAVLDGDLGRAARLALQVRSTAFTMYLTRDLDEAREYVTDRYADQPEARYGILASSDSAKLLAVHGLDSSFMATSRMKVADWYNRGKGEPGSGCNLELVVTEFGCQGLELDMPVIAWADDLVWTEHGWQKARRRRRYPQRDPEQLKENSYRVLLTRGRDGFVIYVPDARQLDSTENALLAAGVQPLIIKAAMAS
jgi:hypothetical protein